MESARTWIQSNVREPNNNCFFYAAVLSRIFNLKLIEGHYGSIVHYWCEDAEGRIIDPTERQLQPGGANHQPGAEYRKEREVLAELNLDAVVSDRLFEQLSPLDQWWVTRRWMMPGDPYFILDS